MSRGDDARNGAGTDGPGDLSAGLSGRRIVVVGTSGSGKTTLARRLAGILGAKHVELDALNWEPGWTQASEEVLRARVLEATAGDAWVVDGNYSRVREIVWSRAETLVWLDYPLRTVLRQVIARTFRRVATREELWNGNRERLVGSVFGRDSIILWALRTYRRRRRDYPALLSRPEHAHLEVLRFRSPRASHEWLMQLAGATEPERERQVRD